MTVHIYLRGGRALIATVGATKRALDEGAASGTLRIEAGEGSRRQRRDYIIPWSSIDRIVVLSE